jgi:16S rRNA (adenine1518-N6/adenine1519-N6)-dimethyltransferase
MTPKFKLDQHFLKDEPVLNKIIASSELKPDDIILEIGPGKGILTSALAKKASKIIAIELDPGFKPYLDKLPANVEVHYNNALNIIRRLRFNKIIANIPYAISEPLLKKLFKTDFELAVLLVGKGFYSTIAGKDSKGSELDSKWAVITPIFFEINKVTDVSRDAFEPRPRTDSVLITLKKRESKLSLAEQIIKELVLQEDKKLSNALLTGFARVEKLTQKQAKEKVSGLNLPEKLLDKKIAYLSNRQFMLIYNSLTCNHRISAE